MNQIIVMRDGVIDENGSYAELMAARGSFSQLIEDYSVKEKSTQEQKAVELKADNSSKDTTKIEPIQNGTESEKDIVEVLPSKGEIAKNDNADLIMEEEAAEGNVGWSVFKNYAEAATWLYAFLSLLGFICSQATQIGVSIWLQEWVSQVGSSSQPSIGVFLGVYAGLVALYILFDLGVNLIIFVAAGIRASRIMHDALLERCVQALTKTFFIFRCPQLLRYNTVGYRCASTSYHDTIMIGSTMKDIKA
ncbi:Multidrug resistance-associated protein 1 [Modicella reniformis]|uniref:Multidrug resistance-associated protein 1 n=1 Tax=Modicella reniformis TaxID=1440133 RepID=A0A9P6JG80_9FUNG|nr:Multidrug resistance-associated protein 1 [Modicella reniformis]